MKTAQVKQTTLDVNALSTLLKAQGFSDEEVQQFIDTAQETMNSRPTQSNPVPTTMNEVPTVMKPMSHLAKAVKLSVWEEPGRPLGPNADIPTMAEAADDDIGDMTNADLDEGGKEEPEEKKITPEEAKSIGDKIGIKWDQVQFTPEAFADGISHELEHGSKDKETNVTNDDPEMTGKIAWVHLKEDAAYYQKLNKLEHGAEDKQKLAATAEFNLRAAMTLKEVQTDVIPRLENDLYTIEVALQDSATMDVEAARDSVYDALAALIDIKEKLLSLGDVDPVVYGGPEEPKEKGFFDKLFK